jgi:hypothetical protein
MGNEKRWVMLVEHEQSKVTIPLYARCPQSAVACMAKELSARMVSDKRVALGKITVQDPEGNAVYVIETNGKSGFTRKRKEKDA